MLHTKSQSQWPFGSREEDILKSFTIYGCGGHFSHVTITICISFDLPIIKELSYELRFQLAKWFLRKLCLNMLMGLQ